MPLVAATHPPGVQHPLPVGGASVSKSMDSPEPVWESAGHLGPPTSSFLRRSLSLSLQHSEACPRGHNRTGRDRQRQGNLSPWWTYPCCFQSGEGAFWGELTWTGEGGRQCAWSFSAAL